MLFRNLYYIIIYTILDTYSVYYKIVLKHKKKVIEFIIKITNRYS